MVKLEYFIDLERLKTSKEYLVPHLFSENYFNILKLKIQNKKLSNNQKYYYTHFIKKKLKGMFELLGIRTNINGAEFIIKERIEKAIKILNKYSRKHKNLKVLISGSFLYKKKYNDIDVFVISKYNKEDYKDGIIHVNFLEEGIENTLFFKSISSVSIMNFTEKKEKCKRISLKEILDLYELVILLIMQKDDYLQELRDLVLRIEYVSNNVILNSMQLKKAVERIIKSKNSIKTVNKYLIGNIVNSFSSRTLIKTLKRYIQKNSIPEKNKEIYENWNTYNKTYKEVIEVAA